MGFATFQFLRGTDRNRSNPSPIPMSKRLEAKWSLQCCIHVLLSPKLIKGSQNPIITKVQCLKSYYNKVHVRNPIIAKRNVWRVIIANFSAFWRSARISSLQEQILQPQPCWSWCPIFFNLARLRLSRRKRMLLL
jgi:hypothetical protein